jgi:hypothetical protein
MVLLCLLLSVLSCLLLHLLRPEPPQIFLPFLLQLQLDDPFLSPHSPLRLGMFLSLLYRSLGDVLCPRDAEGLGVHLADQPELLGKHLVAFARLCADMPS